MPFNIGMYNWYKVVSERGWKCISSSLIYECIPISESKIFLVVQF